MDVKVNHVPGISLRAGKLLAQLGLGVGLDYRGANSLAPLTAYFTARG